MRNLQKFSLVTSAMLALPFIASAQYLTNVQSFIVSIGNIVALLIPISIGATMLVFFYGLFQYVKNGGKDGSKTMIAGIAALFVMVSIWGIIRLAQSALNINPTNTVQAPHFPTN